MYCSEQGHIQLTELLAQTEAIADSFARGSFTATKCDQMLTRPLMIDEKALHVALVPPDMKDMPDQVPCSQQAAA